MIVNSTATTGKGWTIALWIAQLLLAAAYGLFGSMKATQPLDQISIMMKWIPDFPPLFVRTLGIVEVLGAIGIILPSLFRIQPRLTVIAALCILVHQFCAVALHASKGEFDVLGLNVVLIALAAFIF
jgi:DoxX-like family